MATADETTLGTTAAEYTVRHLPPKEGISPARVAALLYFSLGASVFIFALLHVLLAIL